MNKKVLRTLEYDKIVNQAAGCAVSKTAKKRLHTLHPMTDAGQIRQALAETGCACERIRRAGEPAFRGIPDITEAVRRLKVKATLDMSELIAIADLIESAVSLHEFDTQSGPEGKKDKLAGYFDRIVVIPTLSAEIKRCILSADEMADDASAALKLIRQKLASMDARVHDELNSILNRGDNRQYLSNANVTMRDGRYCLPVRAEHKKHFPGVTHDQSGTGSTLFIEPESVIRLNNEYQELLLEEKKEIEKILEKLSAFAGEYADDIQNDRLILTELDFIFAKAKYAKALRCTVPNINTEGRTILKGARHPLLKQETAKPIDVTLGDTFHLCVITGPNTGGKTVSLKTVGLITLMASAGFLIPAERGSDIAVYEEIYADIGDEQSIEQSLSTFSSHMKNITWILRHVSDRTMVLLDELCSGTDPTEGAALATAILEYLRARSVRTMATTHYAQLKVYALSTKGVENASLEFDVETLSPTYRLLIGTPGKSNAFAISEKLGLHKRVIEDAKKRMTEKETSFEDLITDLENSRRTVEKEREEIARLKDEARELTLKLEAKEEKLQSSRDRILREANEQAADILKDAKELADETIRDFRKYGETGADMKQMEAKRTKVREAISDKTRSAGKPENKSAAQQARIEDPAGLKPGDRVYVTTLGMDGEVVSLPNEDGNLTVQVGILKSQVNIRELAQAKSAAPSGKGNKKTGQTVSVSYDQGAITRKAYVSPELMLIGRTVDEALTQLDKYLDDAYLSHLESVRIVHGKGTGTLRSAIHKHLRKLSYVSEYHLGEYGEGDAGVTIVTFR